MFRMMAVATIFNIIKNIYKGHVKMNKNLRLYNKPMCGLWHANVTVSEHNNNGKCECLNCGGTHCHDCSQYARLQEANIALSILEKTRCELCQACQEKTK